MAKKRQPAVCSVASASRAAAGEPNVAGQSEVWHTWIASHDYSYLEGIDRDSRKGVAAPWAKRTWLLEFPVLW